MSHDFPYRQTIRLPGYDYSRNGLYFVTICTHNQENLFGDIVGAKPCFRPPHAQIRPINLNISNNSDLPTNADVSTNPNILIIPTIAPSGHQTDKSGENMVSPLQIIPTVPKFEPNIAGLMIEKWWLKLFEKYPELKFHQYVLMPNHFHGIIEICNIHFPSNEIYKSRVLNNSTNNKNDHFSDTNPNENQTIIPGENMVSPLQGLGRYISWFKRLTTNEYIRMVKEKSLPPFYGKIWQRNYHEHIIRNEKSYQIIAEYINTNPQNWESDSLYQKP